MHLLKLLPVVFMPCLALGYDRFAESALIHLRWKTDHVATFVNGTKECGYSNTTQAINQNAIDPSGSACPAADMRIARKLRAFVNDLVHTQNSLYRSREMRNVSNTDIAERFNVFSASFYNLFNALDLAQCTFGLTASSATYNAAFPKDNITLVATYEGIVGELNHTVKSQVSAANFNQAVHFWGTNLLANVMGTSMGTELQACETVTGIINQKGGIHGTPYSY